MDVKESYNLLEEIVTKGFLTDIYNIDNKIIVIKTLNEIEYSNVKLFIGDDFKELAYYELALSTIIFDGYNVLVDRFDRMKELVRYYKNIDVINFSKIQERFKKLHYKYLASLKYLEGFSYTDKSRYYWSFLGEQGLSSEKISGIEGTGSLGLNTVQNNWIVINKKLDQEDKYNVDFNLATFIASSMNSKGARSASKSYEVQRNELLETRKKISEYGYDKARYEKERSIEEWSKPIKSREDMVRELEKQVSGVKDKHDTFIENWIKNQRKLAEAAKENVENRQKDYRNKLENIDESKIEGSRLATPEEIRELDKKNRYGIRTGTDSLEKYNKQQNFVKKVSSVVLKADK